MCSEEKKKIVKFDEFSMAAQYAVYWSIQSMTPQEKIDKVEKLLRETLGGYYADWEDYKEWRRCRDGKA